MTGYQSSRNWAKLSMPFVVLATIGHGLALWTSFWHVSRRDGVVVRHGLWKSCVSGPVSSICEDIDISSLPAQKQNTIGSTRGAMLIALVCLLTTVVASPLYLVIEGARKERRKGVEKLKNSRDAISLITFFLTPIYVIIEAVRNKFFAVVICSLCFIAAGSIVFGLIMYKAEFEPSMECWSLGFTVVGAVLAAVAGIFFAKDSWGETF